MKVALDRAALADVLGRVSRAFAAKGINACVLLEAGVTEGGDGTTGVLDLQGHNGSHLSIRARATGMVQQPGRLAVEGARLLEVVRALRSNVVRFELEGGLLVVSSDTASSRMATQDAAAFPAIYTAQGDKVVMVSASSRLVSAAVEAVRHASTEGGRAEGCWLSAHGVHALSDGTGARAVVPLEGVLPAEGLCLPKASLDAVLSLCGRVSEVRVGTYVEGGQSRRLYLRGQGEELCVYLADAGAWPQAQDVLFGQVVRDAKWRKVVVQRQALLDALRLTRASIVAAKKGSVDVCLSWAGGQLRVSYEGEGGAAASLVVAKALEPGAGEAPHPEGAHRWQNGQEVVFGRMEALNGHAEAADSPEVVLGLPYGGTRHVLACTVEARWAAAPPPPTGGQPPQLSYLGFVQAMAPPGHLTAPAT